MTELSNVEQITQMMHELNAACPHEVRERAAEQPFADALRYTDNDLRITERQKADLAVAWNNKGTK